MQKGGLKSEMKSCSTEVNTVYLLSSPLNCHELEKHLLNIDLCSCQFLKESSKMCHIDFYVSESFNNDKLGWKLDWDQPTVIVSGALIGFF